MKNLKGHREKLDQDDQSNISDILKLNVIQFCCRHKKENLKKVLTCV